MISSKFLPILHNKFIPLHNKRLNLLLFNDLKGLAADEQLY